MIRTTNTKNGMFLLGPSVSGRTKTSSHLPLSTKESRICTSNCGYTAGRLAKRSWYVCMARLWRSILTYAVLSHQNLYAAQADSQIVVDVALLDRDNIMLVDVQQNVAAVFNLHRLPRGRTKCGDAFEHHASLILGLPPWNTSKWHNISHVKCTPLHRRPARAATFGPAHSSSVILLGRTEHGQIGVAGRSYDLLIPSRVVTSRMADVPQARSVEVIPWESWCDEARLIDTSRTVPFSSVYGSRCIAPERPTSTVLPDDHSVPIWLQKRDVVLYDFDLIPVLRHNIAYDEASIICSPVKHDRDVWPKGFTTAAPYRRIVTNIPVDALGDMWLSEDGVFILTWIDTTVGSARYA